MKILNGVFAEIPRVSYEYLAIVTSLLKCHDFCRSLVVPVVSLPSLSSCRKTLSAGMTIDSREHL